MSELGIETGSKTRLAFGEDARERMLAGIDIVGRALRITLGPKGRNVCRPGYHEVPWVTNDGKAIWEDMELQGRFQNLGVQLLKQAADKVAEAVGDGKTTTTVLAHQMIHEGSRLIASGANPMMLKRGMEIAVRAAVGEILGLARPLNSYDELHKVILTSVVDEEAARVMADAAEKVGGDGIIRVWRNYSGEKVTVEYTNGMKYDRGYLTPYFLRSQTSEGVTLENPRVLVVDGEIGGSNELLPLLNNMKQAELDSLYVVAKDFQGDALGLLLKNNERGVIHCVATRPPGFGHLQSEMLEDISVFTGGRTMGEQFSLPLRYVGVSDLGEADTITVTARDTTIIGGKGDPGTIKARIGDLRIIQESTKDEVELRYLKDRIARLAAATAVVKIGGETEPDREDLLARAESAVSAMAIAEEEGIVPGGGIAYLAAGDALEKLRDDYEGDVALGIDIVRWALEEPLRQIAENSGDSGSVAVANVRRFQKERDNEYLGYDAMTGEYCDLMEAGVVEPAKLDRLVFQYAASCAAMILTTDVSIVQR